LKVNVEIFEFLAQLAELFL